ncbi:amidohydrolase family protein [Pimelobacter simplex]|uniref:amidohydrolase family protein n=1 Tax=Nocardioides simplex TaxID=2045 RepID=UPI002150165B|nr:amidohydrolase family protein [Pimelobacter simplex]UUW90149.1 amidohydrolase family protein [Pimelobacter simplex]UUW93978.1 amidohydrolase family protein [Pimelobacter simplex]
MAPAEDQQTVGTLLRGAQVCGPSGVPEVGDVLLVGTAIAAVARDLGGVPGALPVAEVDAAGHLLVPSFVDQHSHPTGGGGGGGPETLSFPIPFERYAAAGIGTVVGCSGNDSVVRRPEALLARVKGLRRLGLNAHLYTGEIGYPPETITGSIRRDLALVDEVRGVKAAIGGRGSIVRRSQLADLAGEAARGSRSAGRAPVLHLHVEPDVASIRLVARAIAHGDVAPETVTVTHVNWNDAVLDEAIGLAEQGVNVDVTACIRPEFFPGTIDPLVALRALLDQVDAARVTISSDAGGNHPDGPGGHGALVMHQPDLLADIFAAGLRTGLLAVPELVRVFAANPAARLGLTDVGAVRVGARADVLLVEADSGRIASAYLAGRRVVAAGQPVVRDQAQNLPAEGSR